MESLAPFTACDGDLVAESNRGTVSLSVANTYVILFEPDVRRLARRLGACLRAIAKGVDIEPRTIQVAADEQIITTRHDDTVFLAFSGVCGDVGAVRVYADAAEDFFAWLNTWLSDEAER